MKPLFFVHIPKTAGTSLNKAAADYFGQGNIEKDYGVASPETTPLVQDHIYGKMTGDAFGLSGSITAAPKNWLTGHVFAEKYVSLIGAENTLAIVSEPVDRVISEYRHRIEKEGESRSFTDFYRDDHETNKQFRMIGQLPWQAFHLVGIQDNYDDFLSLLNDTKALSLKPLKANAQSSKMLPSVDDEIRDDIRKWNERDCIFVEHVRSYFAKQLETYKSGNPFCYHDLDFAPDKHIIGWAFYQNESDPLEVELYVNGTCVATTHATEYRPELQGVITPRGGHNGFRFVLSDYTDAQSIMLKATKTEQILLDWQRNI